jgi:proteasome accessory factor C
MRARTSANDRVRRLLAIIPWIAERDGPTIAEVCARFGLTRAQLLADLEVVFLVGLHPFTPDELIDVVIEDERVWIHLMPGAFGRPLRLTPEQGLALVAAGASLRAVPGTDPEGPLARGLDKLARLLGIEEAEAVAISLGTAQVDVLELLRSAVAEHRRVHLDYYAYGRDARTERSVDPWQLFADGGEWYLSGYCHLANAERLFRVDRISAACLEEATFEPPAAPVPAGVYHPSPDDPRVTLDLAPGAEWVLDQYAHDEVVPLADGWIRVRLPVSAAPWLERLLLRLGAAARVVATDLPLTSTLGRDAAARVLARYHQLER